YEHTKTALVGRRCEWLEDAWYPDGRVRRWRDGRVLWEARITYRRLLAWRETRISDRARAAIEADEENP
ncbi:hypothetical protein, partial [Nocardia farcinica]